VFKATRPDHPPAGISCQEKNQQNGFKPQLVVCKMSADAAQLVSVLQHQQQEIQINVKFQLARPIILRIIQGIIGGASLTVSKYLAIIAWQIPTWKLRIVYKSI